MTPSDVLQSVDMRTSSARIGSKVEDSAATDTIDVQGKVEKKIIEPEPEAIDMRSAEQSSIKDEISVQKDSSKLEIV